jgi:hypothetical protein
VPRGGSVRVARATTTTDWVRPWGEIAATHMRGSCRADPGVSPSALRRSVWCHVTVVSSENRKRGCAGHRPLERTYVGQRSSARKLLRRATRPRGVVFLAAACSQAAATWAFFCRPPILGDSTLPSLSLFAGGDRPRVPEAAVRPVSPCRVSVHQCSEQTSPPRQRPALGRTQQAQPAFSSRSRRFGAVRAERLAQRVLLLLWTHGRKKVPFGGATG